ncbi:hypothetical protein J27TS7_58420 [Paenibacillus dendritiformis]|nr:hypothetical protein J27TS7_58420 [Paenibacillus dendritiformis]
MFGGDLPVRQRHRNSMTESGKATCWTMSAYVDSVIFDYTGTKIYTKWAGS